MYLKEEGRVRSAKQDELDLSGVKRGFLPDLHADRVSGLAAVSSRYEGPAHFRLAPWRLAGGYLSRGRPWGIS